MRDIDWAQVCDPKRLTAGSRMTSRRRYRAAEPRGISQKSYFRAGNWSMTPCFKARIGLVGLPYASATRLECASSWPGDRVGRRLRSGGGGCEDLRLDAAALGET